MARHKHDYDGESKPRVVQKGGKILTYLDVWCSCKDPKSKKSLKVSTTTKKGYTDHYPEFKGEDVL